MLSNAILKYRRAILVVVCLVCAGLAPFVINLQLDRTLKSAYVTSSEAYRVYERFVSDFGNDEFMLAVVRSPNGVNNTAFLKALSKITDELEGQSEIAEVISLSNFKAPGDRQGAFGSVSVLETQGAELKLPRSPDLQKLHETLPFMDYLISKDETAIGVIIKIQDELRFDPNLGKLIQRIKSVFQSNLPGGADFRLIGPPVVREAVQDITVRTTVIFSALCLVIITLTTFYIFKNIRVAFISSVIIGIAVYWIMGLMALLGIPLNATTSLSFGLVLVVSVSTVIHVVTHYYDSVHETQDRIEAVRQSLRKVSKPALMCSLTTSVAFATIMISTIPMVQQLGFLMAVGVFVAFALAITLTPAALIYFDPIDKRTHEMMTSDFISKILDGLEKLVFQRPVACSIGGIVFTLLMLLGTPHIKIDTQILRLFVNSSPTLSDLRFAEKNLGPMLNVELVLEFPEKELFTPEAWGRVNDLLPKLAGIEGVQRVDSIIPLLQYLAVTMAKDSSQSDALFRDPHLMGELLGLMSINSDGRTLLRRYVDRKYGKCHIILRVSADDDVPIARTIGRIESVAEQDIGKHARVIVTGEQAVFVAQAAEVVSSQVWSLILAFIGVTILMMIQLRSVTLGLLSMLPNIPPIAVIFGIMGWAGIPLDNVTVFAAAIAIGLSVDDTIHYLTELKRDMVKSAAKNATIQDCVRTAYKVQAKAMFSTSLTLVGGFLALSATPTLPAIFFGFLGAAAVVVALLGDLVLLPASILAFPFMRDALNRDIEKFSS